MAEALAHDQFVGLDQRRCGAVNALTGVMEAEPGAVDVVGATFIAVATALGNGTIRDLLNRNIFWIAGPDLPHYRRTVRASCAFRASRAAHRERWFLVPDASASPCSPCLAHGCPLQWHAPGFTASLLGVITGVFGGVLRDVLCNEVPLVMRAGEAVCLCRLGRRAALHRPPRVGPLTRCGQTA